MARRNSPTYGRYGTLTNLVKRTTRGTAREYRSLCRTPSPSARQTALADRIRIVARRTDTTPSGSYVALRTSADERARGRMSGIVCLRFAATGQRGRDPIVPDNRPDDEPSLVTPG